MVGHLFKLVSVLAPMVGHLFKLVSVLAPMVGHLFKLVSVLSSHNAMLYIHRQRVTQLMSMLTLLLM